MIDKTRREVGLGRANDVPLSVVRNRADALRALSKEEFQANLAARRTKKEKEKKPLTFREVSDLYVAWNLQVGNWEELDKVYRVYSGRMKNHILPILGSLQIDLITHEDVAKVAARVWNKPETANRSLRLIKQVFDWARAKGYTPHDNPASRDGPLKYLLPQTQAETHNRGALSVNKLPAFMAELYANLDGEAQKCAFFAILTATRSKTVREARWEQINFEKSEWSIPAGQLKVSRNGALIVPLAPQVTDYLKSLGAKEEGLIFPNPKGRVMTDTIFSRVVKLLDPERVKWLDDEQTLDVGAPVYATMHGIARATFRTWAQDDTLGNDRRFDARIAELCLHHKVADSYNGAYERNRSYLRRKEMMFAWAEYCFSAIEN